jgi:Flp pilus assembly protein TadD
MPLNSSLFHDSGDILLNLYHKRHDRKYLTSATESFQRAVALSPSKAGSHIGLGLCLSSADQMDDALLHIRTALLLYPDSSYAQAIVKLMEQRRTELLAKN